METNTAATIQTTKCDKPDCQNDAAWSYRVSTLYGIETTVACQQHVREVREWHGPNIQSVTDIRR